jgi:hypothetical protein
MTFGQQSQVSSIKEYNGIGVSHTPNIVGSEGNNIVLGGNVSNIVNFRRRLEEIKSKKELGHSPLKKMD